MKVVITGASGFVGRALLQRLRNGCLVDGRPSDIPIPEGLSIAALVHRSSSRDALLNGYPGLVVEHVKALGDPQVGEILRGADTVLHLAWSSVPRTAALDPVGDLAVNVGGGLRLVELAMKAGVGRFIFLSSGGTVYGRKEAPIPEATPLDPLGAYACGKVLFEQYLRTRAPQGGMDHIILRPGNLYGDPKGPTKQQGVVEHWLRCVDEERPIQVWNGSSVVRDYVHVDDMVDALVVALGRSVTTGIFNVGTGVGTSLGDLLQAIFAITGRAVRVEELQGALPEVPWNVLDPSAMRRAWGIAPRVGLAEGLERTWKALHKG